MSMIYPLEYLSVLKRHKMVFLSVSGAIFFASLIVALNWSSYRSIATIEVARSEVSVDTSTMSGGKDMSPEAMADLEISRLRQKVLSVASLGEIIAKYDLYPGARKQVPIAYIAKNMERQIDIRLLSTSLANPASAQKATALQLSAIAFTLSFKYSDPELAQKVVNELVSRFLDEDIREKRENAEKTSEFLQGQIDILSRSLSEQESKIAEYRANNGDLRADSLGFNQQAAISAESRIYAIESDITATIGRIGALNAQLAQTEPYSRVLDQAGEALTTPSIQLRALKSQYATMTAKYGPNHPDVVRLSRQIKALERQVHPVNISARLKANINDLTARLATLKSTYGVEHPDYISAKAELERLNQKLQETEDGQAASVVQDADNPAYLQIVAQLEAAKTQQEALQAQQAELKRQQENFQKAIAANPESERTMAALARDYENMMVLYRDLKARKLAADMVKTIEEGRIGRRLAVIDPPELPLGTSPSRKLILAAGFVLSCMAGLGSVLALHLLSQSVVGPRHLESLIGTAPLVVVPKLRTLDDRIVLRKRLIKVLVALPVIAVVVMLLFFLIVMPFDVFQAVVSRKVGL